MHEPCASRGDCYRARAAHRMHETWGKTEAASEARSRGGRIGARKRNELYGNPATPESCAKGGRIGGRISGRKAIENGVDFAAIGRIGGRKNVESGHLARIIELPQTKAAQRENGRKVGRKNVESGHLARIGELPQSKAAQREVGRKNVESGHLARISKGVPSTADGILFRSQTEAMFYCVFKALGGEPVYEPGFIELDNGTSYRPDFILSKPVFDLPANVPIELKSARTTYYNDNLEKAIRAGAIIVYWNELVE